MSPRSFRRFISSTCGLLVLLIALVASGCDEETLGPDSQGEIKGEVQHATTDEPLSGANVTTSPPTQSILTSDDGTFALQNIPTGNYSVRASKDDFESRSVQVSVRENQTTSATILLEREDEFGSSTDSLSANVTNWFNDRVNRDSTGADSIFVDVEYSARNVGDVPVREYEVYFEIETSGGTFSQEVNGDSLDMGQRDVGRFRKYIPEEAQAVRVDDTYWNVNSD